MQNIFGLCHPNKFRIMSEYDPFIFNHIYCTFFLCFTLYLFGYLKMSEILVIFFHFIDFSLLNLLLVISFPLVTIDRQTFQIIQIHFIQFVYIYIQKYCTQQSCSRDCTKHIRVLYSFSNMIRIFLHFFLM